MFIHISNLFRELSICFKSARWDHPFRELSICFKSARWDHPERNIKSSKTKY